MTKATIASHGHSGITKDECVKTAYDAGHTYVTYRKRDGTCVYGDAVSSADSCSVNRITTRAPWKIFYMSCLDHTCSGTLTTTKVCDNCKCSGASRRTHTGYTTQQACEYHAFAEGYSYYSWRDNKKICVFGTDTSCTTRRTTGVHTEWGIYQMDCDSSPSSVSPSSVCGFTSIALINQFETDYDKCSSISQLRFYEDEACSAEILSDSTSGTPNFIGYSEHEPADAVDVFIDLTDPVNHLYLDSCYGNGAVIPGITLALDTRIGFKFNDPVQVRCVKIMMWENSFDEGWQYIIAGSNDDWMSYETLFTASKDDKGLGMNYPPPDSFTPLINPVYTFDWNTCQGL